MEETGNFRASFTASPRSKSSGSTTPSITTPTRHKMSNSIKRSLHLWSIPSIAAINHLKHHPLVINFTVVQIHLQKILNAPQPSCPRACIPCHRPLLKSVCSKNTTFVQNREHPLLHELVREHQCIEVQLYLKWTGM